MVKARRHEVVCFGEVLWDILPSGAVAGGAPMNVAYHLHKLEKDPALITRIGNDKEGERLLRRFAQCGVCTDYFQVDAEYDTGKVFASPTEDNEVIYDIVKPVAWDFIAFEDRLRELVADSGMFVFGSLAARSSKSRETLLRLLEVAPVAVLDINLRAPFYDRDIVETLLRYAHIVKLNLEELLLISSWFCDYKQADDMITYLAEAFGINEVLVTKGAEGAVYFDQNTFHRHSGYRVQVVDTVGSGDAFLAGFLACRLKNNEPCVSLEFSAGLGALVATREGACPDYSIQDVYHLIER